MIPHKTYFKPPKLTKAEKDQMNAEVRVRDRFCQKCGEWCTRISEATGEIIGGDIHHKGTQGAHGDEAWVLEEMELLCRLCHATIGNKGAT